MTQAQQIQIAINAIRAIGQLYPEDVQSIVQALSCKIASDVNAHLKLHQVAVDSLDDLEGYLDSHIQPEDEEPRKLGYVHTVANVEGVSLEKSQ